MAQSIFFFLWLCKALWDVFWMGFSTIQMIIFDLSIDWAVKKKGKKRFKTWESRAPLTFEQDRSVRRSLASKCQLAGQSPQENVASCYRRSQSADRHSSCSPGEKQEEEKCTVFAHHFSPVYPLLSLLLSLFSSPISKDLLLPLLLLFLPL